MTKFIKLSIFLISSLIMTFVLTNDSYACSMIKVTKNGKTIVGNNEDQMNPNTSIWFEKGKNGEYGVAYVGFDNLFPQGAINEAGLVFDSFSQAFKKVTQTEGKKKISAQELEKKIMRECASVDDVKKIIIQYNIDFWSSAVIRFIDKNGNYLYVDGDDLLIGNDEVFVQTNVRPNENKDCWRLNKGTYLLENNFEASVDYTKSVMDSIHQETDWGGTMYATVYDLNNTTIYLYYLYDYENVVIFDLKDELKKEDRILKMPDLFVKNKSDKKYYNEYNKILGMIKQLGDSSAKEPDTTYNKLKQSIHSSFIASYPFYYKIYHYALFYLNEEPDFKRAILLLKLNTEIYPKDWRVYDILGDALVKNEQYQLAFDTYSQSSELNPDNKAIVEKKEKLKKYIHN